MSRPEHYSLEIVTRCERLVERLTKRVDGDPKLVDDWGGPLRTTFLLAMSTPMIVLPMERLFRPLFSKAGVANDTELDIKLADRVRDTLGPGQNFSQAPFFEAESWAYLAAAPTFPVARAWPEETFAQLAAPESFIAAANAPASDILECLRNALAHGGIVYLDQHGRQTDAATNMLGFASYTRDRKGLQLLRISVDGYQRFLRAWSNWVSERQIENKLAEAGPGWFEEEPQGGPEGQVAPGGPRA